MTNADEFRAVCKAQHWKCTPQRLAVYHYMHGNSRHPSVDDVWTFVRKRIPSITRESVYRILNEFSAAGIVSRMDMIDNAHYDVNVTPHGHLVCEKCGGVTDFPLDALPKPPRGVPKENIRNIEVRMIWLCPVCAGKEAKK